MKQPVINTAIGARPELAWVAVDAIAIDRNYQRDLRETRVGQILREFDWSQFQPVMLAKQADGTFNVFDGQHRVEAARRHPLVNEVPACIVRLDNMREEAGAFIGVNVNRSAVSTIERYWAGLEAGDPDMMQVCSVLEEAGCEVVQAPGCNAHNRTNAVTAVSRAIKYFGEGSVIFACSVLREAWANDIKAQKGNVITALARIHRANPDLDRSRMIGVLAETSRHSLSADAETMRKIGGGEASTAIAKTLCGLYNRAGKGKSIVIGVKK